MYVLVSLRKNRKAPAVLVKVMKSNREGRSVKKQTVKYLGTLKLDESRIPGVLSRFLSRCFELLENDPDTKDVSNNLKAQLERKIGLKVCGYTNSDTGICTTRGGL